MASERERLAPCPFCSCATAYVSQGRVSRIDYSGPIWKVLCPACRAASANYDSADAAIAAWSRRASAPPADVAQLIDWHRRNATAIYIAVEEAVAKDISAKSLETADALASLAAQRDRWKAMFELSQRTKDRWAPCPDHRDKVDFSKDGCPVCRIERLEKDLAIHMPRAALGGSA